MKLSELLKAEHAGAPPKTPPPTLPVRTPKEFLPPKAVLKEKEAEAAVREKMEKEYEEKLAAMKADLEKSVQKRLDDESKKIQEKEDAIKKEMEQKSQKMEHEKNILSQFQTKLEGHVMEQMESQRRKIEEQFRNELGIAQMALDEMRKAMAVKDQEIDFFKKAAQSSYQMPSAPSASAPAPAPASASVPASPVSQFETPPAAFKPAQPEKRLPPLPDLPELSTAPPAKEAVKLPPPVVYEENPEWHAKAVKIRDQLLEIGQRTFDLLQLEGRLDLAELKAKLVEMMSLIEKRDVEFLTLVLEPYLETRSFLAHAVNTTIVVMILAQEFEFDAEQKMDLGLATFLHDVGLLNVQEDLNYPKQLTTQMQQEVLKHPEKGVEILQSYLAPAALQAVLQHHEVGNGKGYPKGLSSSEIHIFAHIIHVADSFEALVHERPYRNKPLEVNEAMKQLIDSGRGVYDKAVLKALMSRIGLYPVMSYVELNNKKIATVIRQNRHFPLSPTVRVEFDEGGVKLKAPQIIDLSSTHFVHIVGPAKKEMAEFPKSQFASPEPAEEAATDMAEILRNVILVAIILSVLGVLVYAVIKI